MAYTIEERVGKIEKWALGVLHEEERLDMVYTALEIASRKQGDLSKEQISEIRDVAKNAIKSAEENINAYKMRIVCACSNRDVPGFFTEEDAARFDFMLGSLDDEIQAVIKEAKEETFNRLVANQEKLETESE